MKLKHYKRKIKKYAKKLAKGAEALPKSFWKENCRYTVTIPFKHWIYMEFDEELDILEYFLKIFAKYAGENYESKYGSVYFAYMPYPADEIPYQYAYITRMECQPHFETV